MADMDSNMMDVDYDIEIDADPGIDMQVHEPIPAEQLEPLGKDDREKPAAYFESLETFAPVPELLNLHGVDRFGPNDPVDYALEHYPASRPRRVRWVNDSSCNLEYEHSQDAADALVALTHPQAGDPADIPAQTPRKARSYSARPDNQLTVREANTGDQKERNAANRSRYYKENPHARERNRHQGRREPPPQYLDYDGEAAGRKNSFDESMYDDRPSSNYDNGRARRPNNSNRRDGDRGRQDKEIDSYRPGSDSPRESRYGRLRGRSASPGGEGDGRFGFSEQDSSSRRYRSRSRDRRRLSRSRERSPNRSRNWNHDQDRDRDREYRRPESARWEQDRSIVFTESGRWAKTPAGPPKPETKVHRRSDATDETHNKGSLLSRMTKNGKPLIPTRSLESRITRDSDDSNYGRLKDDDSAPRENNFQEPMKTKRDLSSRITWSRDKGEDQDVGFSIRGAAPQSGGFSIRGAAGGV